MKIKIITLVWLLWNLGILKSFAQCVPASSYTITQNPVCSLQKIGPFGASDGIVKILLSPLTVSNTYRFSTVGLTTGDTHLYLYDDNGLLLAENDDNSLNNVDTYESRQSTIIYTPTSQVLNGYLLLSKKGCSSLDFDTELEYNVINLFDYPFPIQNLEDNMCVGNTVTLTVPAGGNPKNWESSDTTVATITNTGEVTFLAEGLVEISVTAGSFSCISTKKCKVIDVQTSVITKN